LITSTITIDAAAVLGVWCECQVVFDHATSAQIILTLLASWDTVALLILRELRARVV
jgi:hypothetical protein